MCASKGRQEQRGKGATVERETGRCLERDGILHLDVREEGLKVLSMSVEGKNFHIKICGYCYVLGLCE